MCWKEHYGNCDPKTKNNEYCIFHKPDKNEEEAKLFYQKLLEKLKPEEEEIVIDGRKIKRYKFKNIDCRGYVFPPPPEEYRNIFQHALIEKADFGGAEFERVNFKGAEIKWAGFGGAKIKIASFYEAKIERISFGGAKIIAITFEKAELKRANFRGSKIEWAYFREAKIEWADFTNAVFYFIYLLPQDVEESRNASVITKYIANHINVPTTVVQLCNIVRVFYKRQGDRDMADMVFVAERRVLRWRKVEMASKMVRECKENSGFSNCLRKRLGLLRARLSSFIEWGLADLTCEYGINWRRPLLVWIAVVLLIFPVLYMLFNSVNNTSSLIDYWYFSVITATTVGFGDIYPVGIGRVLAGIEAIFGMFMWTIFLLVFTRKYMS